MSSETGSITLDFEAHDTLYATHGLHAFAAKCPPPLARWAIDRYTQPGDVVVDPMVGSGTTLVESVLAGRQAIGLDIDPLARLIAKVKSHPIPIAELDDGIGKLLCEVEAWPNESSLSADDLPKIPSVERWFSPSVATALINLRQSITGLDIGEDIRDLLWVAYSSLITARTSVANARDLVHSRHHFREHLVPPNVPLILQRRLRTMRRQMEEFVRLQLVAPLPTAATVLPGDARRLPIKDGSARLVFTSPPYCNALDYTRAHAFSVGWLAEMLSTSPGKYVQLGRNYIGSERGRIQVDDTQIPNVPFIRSIVDKVATLDERRGRIVARYFADMARVVDEAARVLVSGGVLVLVVCPSHIRKTEIPTHEAFVAIACREVVADYAWELVAVYERAIDDRKRLLPYMQSAFGDRMKTEFVVILSKGVKNGR